MSAHEPGFSALSGSVDMTHGGGGRAMADLIRTLFQKHFSNPILDEGNDGALMSLPPGRVVMSTDGHVIAPLFFPGGDIGTLAINGTVNDVAMMGAKPLYLSVGFILEEGFPLADLERIVMSMAAAAKAAQVTIVTGDTKVVEKGKGDGVFITSDPALASFPRASQHREIQQNRVRPCSFRARWATMASRSCPSAKASNSRPRSKATAPH